MDDVSAATMLKGDPAEKPEALICRPICVIKSASGNAAFPLPLKFSLMSAALCCPQRRDFLYIPTGTHRCPVFFSVL